MYGTSYLAILINRPFLPHFSLLKLVSIDFLGRTIFGRPGPILAAKFGPARPFSVQNWSGRTVFTRIIFSVTGPPDVANRPYVEHR